MSNRQTVLGDLLEFKFAISRVFQKFSYPPDLAISLRSRQTLGARRFNRRCWPFDPHQCSAAILDLCVCVSLNLKQAVRFPISRLNLFDHF